MFGLRIGFSPCDFGRVNLKKVWNMYRDEYGIREKNGYWTKNGHWLLYRSDVSIKVYGRIKGFRLAVEWAY
jgi:hypothetical protein